MKKLIIAFLAMSFGSFSIASAELGVNIGFSGQMGVFVADGSETEAGTLARSNTTTLVAYESVFIEKTLGSRLTIGYDYVPASLSTDTAESTRCLTLNCATTGVNSVKADFEDLTTIYATLNITENFYIKAGSVTVDVLTKESLATGSAYGNTSLDGTTYGAGYNYGFSNGIFLRAEANVIEMDGVSLTSTTNAANIIKLDHLNGASGKVSIGKSF